MMRGVLIWGAWLLLAAIAFSGSTVLAAEEPGELRVFAAASLTEAFQEISEEFEAGHPGLEVKLNFGGSNALASQLMLGARADVFASANQTQMERLEEEGLLEPGSRRNFARNALVVIWHRQFMTEVTSLEDLAAPGSTAKIIIADDEVPVGRYTRLALETAARMPEFPENLWERVNEQVVSREMNVKSVYMKVKLGEADLGFVYFSDVPREDCETLGVYPLPDAVQPEISYPITVLKEAPSPQLAARFQAYVLSPAGQALLAKHGFWNPSPDAQAAIEPGIEP